MKEDDPKINVFNRQRKLAIDVPLLKSFLHRLAARLKLISGFSVVLVSAPAMRKYNRQFASIDKPTDVLSFPAGGESEAGYLGDILVCSEVANRQKKESLTEELQILCLHGVLHLIGYDHEKDDGEMEEMEQGLKREFRLQ